MFSAIIFPRNGRHNVGCMVQGRVVGTVFLVLYWPRNETLSSKKFNGNWHLKLCMKNRWQSNLNFWCYTECTQSVKVRQLIKMGFLWFTPQLPVCCSPACALSYIDVFSGSQYVPTRCFLVCADSTNLIIDLPSCCGPIVISKFLTVKMLTWSFEIPGPSAETLLASWMKTSQQTLDGLNVSFPS